MLCPSCLALFGCPVCFALYAGVDLRGSSPSEADSTRIDDADESLGAGDAPDDG
jgi:hypothetical protein